MIKVALIGYGHLGKWHLEKSLSFDFVEIVAVVDPCEQTENKLKEKGVQVPVHKSLDSVIDDIDAAIVVTPTSFHYEIVCELLERGKHVFCEKPMTSTFEQAQKVSELVHKYQVVFQVGHSERCHEVWETIRSDHKAFFSNDAFIKIERQAPFKGRATDVDVVQDLMIHDLDLLNYLLNESPYKINAKGYKIRTDHWDYVCADLFYSSGRRAQIISGRNYVEEVRAFEVMGQQGALKVNLMDCTLEKAPCDTNSDHVISIPYNKRDHLMEEQKAFFASILKGNDILVTVEDGVKAVFLVEKVIESVELNKEVTLEKS